ncbi:Hypothetical protein SMAX5B_020120 [Scophthalmus maximus]|uniref:Uncharacterized protein n=1 Tax=Scophthalmus maximus TaxID=52904 RepID=A0A2U9CL13_SCOMX|nr:Hypothetical protein SMAX5B_020120 [Scophthalmus maximus]
MELPSKALTFRREQLGVQCLAQGGFVMRTGGAGGFRTTNPAISRQPALQHLVSFAIVIKNYGHPGKYAVYRTLHPGVLGEKVLGPFL